MMEKKVFILGAGASATVNLPLQSQLLNKIFTLKEEEVNLAIAKMISLSSSTFLDDIDYPILVLGTFKEFNEKRKELAKLLVLCFGNDSDVNELLRILEIEDANDTDYEGLFCNISKYNLSFENIFTFLDKSITLPEFLHIFTDEDAIKFHRALVDTINYLISYNSLIQKDNTFLADFSKAIYDYRTSVNVEDDNLALISINWDSLFDSFIHKTCEVYSEEKAEIDYCIHNNSLDGYIPSIKIKANNIYNIKMLKPHGSTNWLFCKNCNRIFSHYTNDIAIRNLSKDISSILHCPYCKSENKASDLSPLIITPTYMKSLEHVHLKSIWHNMYIELSEADTIYFIGYSLPTADFEFKYILKKAIRKNASIKVILHSSDNPQTYEYVEKEHFYRLDLPEIRYKELFANHNIEFNYSGFDKAFYSNFFKL